MPFARKKILEPPPAVRCSVDAEHRVGSRKETLSLLKKNKKATCGANRPITSAAVEAEKWDSREIAPASRLEGDEGLGG